MEENKKDEVKENVIVPAYMKKENKANDSTKKGNSKKIVVKDKKKFIKMIILAAIALALVIGLICLISFGIRVLVYKKYDPYSLQIKNYGLARLYNNGKETSYDDVTRSEAIKIIISSINNIENVDILYPSATEYENEAWILYAEDKKVLAKDEINKKNAGSSISYIEFIRYYADARKALLSQNLDTSTYPNFSDIKGIKNEELYALSDLISKGAIENSNGKINPNRKLYKGELNKIACDIIKAYNLLIPSGEKFNISDEKIPDNSSEYPYILFNVDKSTYEMPFKVNNKDKFKGPIDTFIATRASYSSVVKGVNSYFNAILNVNYENIDAKKLYEIIDEYSLFDHSLSDVEEYAKYVRDHKIKIEGSAKTQSPIIYFDGVYFRLRTKIEFKVVSSDTKKNLLYSDLLDLDSSYEYTQDSYSFFIDAILSRPTSTQKRLYVWIQSLYKQTTEDKVVGFNKIEKENPLEITVEDDEEDEPTVKNPNNVTVVLDENDVDDEEDDEDISNKVQVVGE